MSNFYKHYEVFEQKYPRGEGLCQECGKKVYGGHNTVSVLPSPIMSYHIYYHLPCFMKRILEDMTTFPNETAEKALLIANMKPPGMQASHLRDVTTHYIRNYAHERNIPHVCPCPSCRNPEGINTEDS